MTVKQFTGANMQILIKCAPKIQKSNDGLFSNEMGCCLRYGGEFIYLKNILTFLDDYVRTIKKLTSAKFEKLLISKIVDVIYEEQMHRVLFNCGVAGKRQHYAIQKLRDNWKNLYTDKSYN